MTARFQLLDQFGQPINTSNPLPVVIPGGITLAGEVEIKNDAGNPVPVSGAVSLAAESLSALENTNATVVNQISGYALDASVTAATASLGTDGGSPPSIAGTGVRGWLRGIYEKIAGFLTVDISRINGAAHAAGNPLFSDVVDRAGRALGAVSGTVTANQGTAGASAWPVSGPITNDQLRASAFAVSAAQNGTWNVRNQDSAGNAQLAITTDPSGAESGLVVRTISKSVNLCVSVIGASAAAVTASLPAVTGQYHYITKIEIILLATVARTATATGVNVTSTNLPGAFAETMNTGAQALGTSERVILDFNEPLKSISAGAITTLVAPATASVLWRLNVFYYAAP